MNCPRCSGPLSPVPGRTYLFCEYCSAFHHPVAPDGSVDRILVLGEEGELTCPTCREMLRSATAEGCGLLQCRGCSGLLLTQDDFALLVRTRRAAREEPPAEPTPLNAEELKREVRCPVCRKRMETHPYYGPGNAVIDSCASCKVVWLDCGELTAIERAPGRRW